MMEVEVRRQKALEADAGKARQGQKEFLSRERAAKVRQNEDQSAVDQNIVESLYSLEVKLQVGQQRAKHWQDENIKHKAQQMNNKVEQIKEVKTSHIGNAFE